MTAGSPSTVDLAIRLVVAGATVFPVRLSLDEKGKKRPSYPGSWDQYQMAAATAQEIAEARAYGVDCGRSGVVVVDLDRKEEANGVNLWRNRGLPQSPFVVRTQAGGEHHYFRAPAESVGNASFKTLGVDIRGQGGHVFGPGSTVDGGGSYALEGSLPSLLAELPEYPAAVVEALREEDKANKRAAAEKRRPEAFTPAPAGAGTVEQCEHRVREQLAILEESVTGGFNDELNRLVGFVGQLFRAMADADSGEQYTVDDVRAHVVELCEASEVIGPLDPTDWGTINSTGAQWGLENPFNPGGPSEAELDWSAQIDVSTTPVGPAPTPVTIDLLAPLYGVTADSQLSTDVGPPRSRLWNTLLSTDTLKGDPPPTPPYVLDGLLREGELAALVSAAKAGKSLLTFERVLQAVARGRRIVYLDAENGLYDIHTRVSDLGFGGDTDLSGLIYLSFPSAALDNATDAREFQRFMAELTITHGKIDAAVLDTASRFLEGAENDAEPWLSMYRLALAPLKRSGIAVLRLDHLGKDETKGARGSSAKSGDVDTVWELKASDPPPGKRVPVRVELTCTMQRSGTHARYTVMSRDVVDDVLGHRPEGSVSDGGVTPTTAPAAFDKAAEIVAILDRAQAPVDVGEAAGKAWLKDRGVEIPKARSGEWTEAKRRRKGRSITPSQPPVSERTRLPKILPDPLPDDLGKTLREDVPDLGKTGKTKPENEGSPAETRLPKILPAWEDAAPQEPLPNFPHPLGGGEGGTSEDRSTEPSTFGVETKEDAPPVQLVPWTETKAKAAAKRTKLTDEEKAERKAAQAEARRKAAEEKRAATLAEASGPRVELPAIVDRAGKIRSVTLDESWLTGQAAIARSGALTVDVETSGRPLGHRDYALRTIQLGDAMEAVVLDAAEAEQAITAKHLLAAAPKLHAFSASADLVPLIAAELADESIWERMFDVVIPAKLADPQSTGSDAEGLKELARDVLGSLATAPAAEAAKNAMFKAGGWLVKVKPDTPLERNGWAQVDSCSTTMVRYAASDVLDTAALGLKLSWPTGELWHRESTAAVMTSRAALTGFRLDPVKVRALHAEQTAAKTEAAERVSAEGVKPGSDAQVAAKLTAMGVVLPRTKPSKTHPQGQPSAAEGAIEPLLTKEGPWQPLVRAVLDYREHVNRLGLFLGPWLDLIENGDGRARPTIYTLQADTGRMSCVRPNFQQVPQTGGFRSCVVSDPGYRGIGADFSGVELRVLAALSRCAELRRYIEEEDNATPEEQARGVGLHWQIAREVWGPDATKLNRYQAKRGVFGYFYGIGIAKLAATLGISEALAKSIMEMLRALAPGAAEWSEQLKLAVRSGQTQFETHAGRVIHLPAGFPHKAPNYAIQGSARELLVDALVKWQDTRWGNCTLLPVHDELIVMVPEDEAEEATAELVRCMETELYGVKIKVEADAPWIAWPDAA